jgi:hypothetical protein
MVLLTIAAGAQGAHMNSGICFIQPHIAFVQVWDFRFT